MWRKEKALIGIEILEVVKGKARRPSNAIPLRKSLVPYPLVRIGNAESCEDTHESGNWTCYYGTKKILSCSCEGLAF